MRKAFSFLWIVFFLSLSYAQSESSRFIESPSWVLAQESSLSVPSPLSSVKPENPSTETAPVGGGTTTSSSFLKEASREISGKNQAVQATKKRRHSEEGFLHFGIYLTPVVNWLSSLNEPYERSGVSFNATPTLMFDMRLFGRFYVGVGAAFNTLGGTIAYPDINTVKHERTYTFSYIDIPARVKIQTPNFADSKGSMFFSGGVNVGFGMRYHFKDVYKGFEVNTGDMGVQSGRFIIQGQMPEDSRLMNVSAVGQIGFNYQLSTRINLVIGVEYHYGLVKPLKWETGNSLGVFPEYNNQQVGLILGVMF